MMDEKPASSLGGVALENLVFTIDRAFFFLAPMVSSIVVGARPLEMAADARGKIVGDAVLISFDGKWPGPWVSVGDGPFLVLRGVFSVWSGSLDDSFCITA